MLQKNLKKHIKASLRVMTNDEGISSEIDMLIGAAKSDLIMSGIKKDAINSDEIDDVIVLAITMYCKSKFGFDNPEKDELYESYRMLETHLALSGEYKEVKS